MKRALLTTAVLAAACISSARGQCGWLPGAPGVGSFVWAAAMWDRDGPGPATDTYVAGSGFGAAVMVWTGSDWQRLGAAMSGQVFALATFNGSVVAAGGLSEAGGQPVNNIVRWDGVRWVSLGVGVNGAVHAQTCMTTN